MKKTDSMLLLPMLILPAAPAISATLAGDTVDAFVSVDYGSGPVRKSGFGLDGPFLVVDGTSDIKQYSSVFTLNVDGNGFDMQYLLSLGQWVPGAAFTLTDLDFFSPEPVVLTGLSIDTNLSGYSAEIGPNYVRLLLGNVYNNSSSYFHATFITSPVPEPSIPVLSAIGLAVVATKVRRKRTLA